MKKIFLAVIVAVYASCSYAEGSYIEYKLSSENKPMGSLKVYTQDDNSRSEISITMPQLPTGINITTLMLKGDTKKAYMLDDKAKTYSEMDLDNPSAKEYAEMEYEVTVIGKEKVNGYNATHVKVKGRKYGSEQELWTSTEVANYAKYKNVRSKYTNNAMFKALADKGADGFPVRIVAVERGKSLQMDLVKAESTENPAALFSLNGYTKSNPQTPRGAPSQEMIQQFQNMTPEQREEMIKKMKEQYGQPK